MAMAEEMMEVSFAEAYAERKRNAYAFLEQLQAKFNATIPASADMRKEIRQIVVKSKTDDSRKHMRRPEEAFLNTYIVPGLFEFLTSTSFPLKMDKGSARHAILSENYRNMREHSSGTPARTQRHPFGKVT